MNSSTDSFSFSDVEKLQPGPLTQRKNQQRIVIDDSEGEAPPSPPGRIIHVPVPPSAATGSYTDDEHVDTRSPPPPRPLVFNNTRAPVIPADSEKSSLATYNAKIKEDLENHRASLIHWIHEVVQEVSQMPREDVTDMDQRELKLVNAMNEWVARIDFVGSEPRVAVRYLQNKDHYSYNIVSLSGFRAMFMQYSLSSYNKKDYQNFINYKPHREVTTGNGRGGTRRAELNPYYKEKKDKEDGSVTLSWKVKEEVYSVAEIWLNHPAQRVCTRPVCNPRPAHFKNSALPYELNVCEYHYFQILAHIFRLLHPFHSYWLCLFYQHANKWVYLH
jgi:hypothetical protein